MPVEQVRIIVTAPTEGQVWVVSVPPTNQVLDLTDPRYGSLAQEIANGTPMVITAHGADVFYKFAQASGVVDPNAMSNNAVGVQTGAAQQLGDIKVAGQVVTQPETIPQLNTFLIARTLTATGVLRLKTVG